MSKDIKQKQDQLPAEFNEMLLEDAGSGLENIKQDDLTIPRLGILQKMSPQADEAQPEYIEGAKAGMIFNTVTSELFSENIIVIPVVYKSANIEWKLREQGGGLVAVHGPDKSILDTCTRDEKGRMINAAGNQIVPTAEYYVFLVQEDKYTPCVINMSSSQLKKSRRWNTLMKTLMVKKPDGSSFNPAAFYQSYLLKTVREQNDQGSWYGWDIALHKPTIELEDGKQLYMAAREFKDAVLGGKVKAADVKNTDIAETDDDPM